MAIIKQELFVIRDTINNKLMLGAKGQLAFDTAAAARRSLVHTNWWGAFKSDTALRKTMPNADVLLQRQADLQEEYNRLAKTGWRNIDQGLRDAKSEADRVIYKWEVDNSEIYGDAVSGVKFSNQKTYVIESLVSIETKEV